MSTRRAQPRPRRNRLARLSLAALTLVGASACINTSSERGVEPRWRDADPAAFEPGRTTRSQVLQALGPPSQILDLAEGTALYYMLEAAQIKGMILLLYNQRRERTSYDLAVFFFDDEEVLTDYALSAADR